METAIRKRFWTIIVDQAEASAHLRQEYEQWRHTRNSCYEQIKLFFSLTGSLPVVGDHLGLGGNRGPYYQALQVTKRLISSTADSEELLLVYELEAETIEELEEYQDGDMVEDV
ncbi:hypothetical protein [Hymenobacter lucidus]|uniref:DUF4288 domain-containing protein n=1 Tax=Hymenobacter lucidus TaxID=2880930 RepID=A0ABS8ALD9_9BACT|nr:hypothetical protein [Hymenobacter lucidus]MCB2407015.1 hypothetical protein [Hymenobacter lucidus]